MQPLRPSPFASRPWDFGVRVFPLGLLLSIWAALAQPPAPPSRDPLMNLMLAQPRIDVDSPVVATAWFDPPVVQPGELSIYRVTFNALEESVEWPAQVPAPPDLNLQPGAHGHLLQMTGPSLVPRASFNYRARALKAGQFFIPPYSVEVYGKPVKVPAAVLQVVASTSAPLPPAQRLVLNLSSTNAFAGQPVRAVVMLPGSTGGVLRSVTQVQLIGQGMIADVAAARMRVEMITRPGIGANLPTFIYETTLTPLVTGKILIFAQGFADGQRAASPVVVAGGALTVPPPQPQFVLLESEPIELNVRPLPREGALAGFTGAIGLYTLSAPNLSTNVIRVGNAITLSVKVIAGTNTELTRLVAPPPPRLKDWQVFPATFDNLPPQAVHDQGFTTMHFTLIPLSDQAQSTPRIPFSYFDPIRARYTDLSIPPVAITIQPGQAPADLQALLQPDAQSEPELTLGELAPNAGRTGGNLAPIQLRAWFPMLQLAPGVFFLGVWGWDRRRRHLEQHPDIIVRRRARRALRRERRVLRRAARAGDAPRFASAALNALRVACAPHYPAEPRALVGSDVLSLLSEADRAGFGGDVVRGIFTVTDASRFSQTSPDAAALLTRRADLERVLLDLEQRL